ncbi:sensor histidine kinase [Cohnella abietis]|uniref:histidine kinase n=1 Tax=Cohnella abietis TaxID=2507935 RepID=A0A3T1DEP7_9BACL|nr:ATP-binding protein [Cohnella abietis]BBI36563.1 two-component sensor histidine kinase [Cohnella abietis]
MNATIELIFMIASLLMMGIILFSVYGFRRERGVSYLIGVIVCRIVYSSGVIMEKNSLLLMEKLFFRNIQTTALNLMVPFFILFTYQLIGRDRLLKPRWKIMLFTGFALWSMLSWLDPELHMIYRMIELHNGVLIGTRTVYSAAFSITCYSALAVCFYFLFQYIWNIRNDFRTPGLWVLFLSSFPIILEIVKFTNPQWSSWMLPLSVYCGFIGTIMLVITLRIKFFSTVPIARNIVLDTLQESIVIANASGKIIDSNKQASQWFSKMGSTVINGRNMSELLEPWPEWHNLCSSMQQGRVEIDTWLDGERKIYSVSVYPLRILRKQGQGSISLIVDITEKERHLEQIAHLNKLKDQLFTIVSHDIRSPLALQFQLVELLEEDRDRFDPDHRAIIETLGEQIRYSLGMTNNLLEWFRSQREDMTLRPQVLELSEVIEECCHMLHINSEAKHISVNNSVALGTRVYADREALGLIIRNLLSNAIKFTGLGGLIQVYAQFSGDMVIVSVRDNGVGMEAEQVRELFEQKQLHSLAGTLGEKGTGLGLLVSRQFVQLSGGSLWVESEVGQGSVFHFTVRGGGEQ